MPNVQVSVYLTGEEYQRYWPNKGELNEVARVALKKELKKVK